MGYRSGIGETLAKKINIKGRLDSHIYCNYCGITISACKKGSTLPLNWFLKNKSPPGWITLNVNPRIDMCPTCRNIILKE